MAYSLRLVPFFQQAGQSRKEFLLQIIHTAPVQLMVLGIFADGQAIYEPLPEVVLVLRQHGFQGVIQKLQVLFQFGEATPGDGNESSFLQAEAIFVSVEVVVLTEIFCVCVIGIGLLILSGVVCFIQRWSLPFTNRPTEALLFQPLYGLSRYLHVDQPLYLTFHLPFTSTKAQKDFLLEV